MISPLSPPILSFLSPARLSSFRFIFREMGHAIRSTFYTRGSLPFPSSALAQGFEFLDLFHLPTNPSPAIACGCRTSWLTFSTSPASVLPSLSPRMTCQSQNLFASTTMCHPLREATRWSQQSRVSTSKLPLSLHFHQIGRIVEHGERISHYVALIAFFQ